VTGKQVTIAKRVDPSLLGGVVTRVGDHVFDGSLKNRLKELTHELSR
jgi:F-type H+-transporting ATPase subunit delta